MSLDMLSTPTPQWLKILRYECERYKVNENEVRSKLRARPIARVRHIVWHRMRHELGLSYPQIGMLWGVNHTSCGYAVAKIDQQAKYGAP